MVGKLVLCGLAAAMVVACSGATVSITTTGAGQDAGAPSGGGSSGFTPDAPVDAAGAAEGAAPVDASPQDAGQDAHDAGFDACRPKPFPACATNVCGVFYDGCGGQNDCKLCPGATGWCEQNTCEDPSSLGCMLNVGDGNHRVSLVIKGFIGGDTTWWCDGTTLPPADLCTGSGTAGWTCKRCPTC